MGRSIRIRYEVRMKVATAYVTPMAWNTRQAGRPTAANLAAYVALYNESLKPGGCNSHVGMGATCLVADIIDYDNERKVVAEWRAK